MNREELIEKITQYIPCNEQETADRVQMLRSLTTVDDIFHRSNPVMHMTASAWVTNKTHTKVLMAYHNIYDSWAWMGGHADGEEDLLAVAIKEVKEESGLTEVVPVTEDIISLEILTVDGHVKRGEYVSSHLHYNITFLLEADDRADIASKPDENSAVGWFTPEDAIKASTEPWFQERIYSKLNARLGFER